MDLKIMILWTASYNNSKFLNNGNRFARRLWRIRLHLGTATGCGRVFWLREKVHAGLHDRLTARVVQDATEESCRPCQTQQPENQLRHSYHVDRCPVTVVEPFAAVSVRFNEKTELTRIYITCSLVRELYWFHTPILLSMNSIKSLLDPMSSE